MARRKNEDVMVVHRSDIFARGEWTGINPELLRLIEIARLYHKFLPRWGKHGVDEKENSEWQQIIPFGILSSHGKIFSYVKSNRSSETRLHGERFLGIAGHLRKSDTIEYGSLLGWFQREWLEEIRYEGLPFVWPIGVIHDPSRPVSSVHLGFAFLLFGHKLSVCVNDDEELIEAKWLTLKELDALHESDRASGLPGIENWSRLIMDYLKNNRELLAL